MWLLLSTGQSSVRDLSAIHLQSLVHWRTKQPSKVVEQLCSMSCKMAVHVTLSYPLCCCWSLTRSFVGTVTICNVLNNDDQYLLILAMKERVPVIIPVIQPDDRVDTPSTSSSHSDLHSDPTHRTLSPIMKTGLSTHILANGSSSGQDPSQAQVTAGQSVSPNAGMQVYW